MKIVCLLFYELANDFKRLKKELLRLLKKWLCNTTRKKDFIFMHPRARKIRIEFGW